MHIIFVSALNKNTQGDVEESISAEKQCLHFVTA